MMTLLLCSVPEYVPVSSGAVVFRCTLKSCFLLCFVNSLSWLIDYVFLLYSRPAVLPAGSGIRNWIG